MWLRRRTSTVRLWTHHHDDTRTSRKKAKGGRNGARTRSERRGRRGRNEGRDEIGPTGKRKGSGCVHQGLWTTDVETMPRQLVLLRRLGKTANASRSWHEDEDAGKKDETRPRVNVPSARPERRPAERTVTPRCLGRWRTSPRRAAWQTRVQTVGRPPHASCDSRGWKG